MRFIMSERKLYLAGFGGNRYETTLEELKNSWIAQEKTPCIFISAKNRTNIEKLRSDIYKMVAEIHAGRYPFNNFLW